MARIDIINRIGTDFLTSNIENGEFSYKKAFSERHINFDDIKITNSKGRTYQNLDLRFCDDKNKFVILVETKQDINDDFDSALDQLSAYVKYEKQLTNYAILSILANTKDESIVVWKDDPADDKRLSKEVLLKTFTDYLDLIKPKHINNREEVMKNTFELNELLHHYGITEKIRGQFVGTCLLAIKNNLVYRTDVGDNGILDTDQIIAGIRKILGNLLSNDLKKAEKLAILDIKVLDKQDVTDLTNLQFGTLLDFITTKIYPFINDKSTLGQDLLNLFFTTFNKYVGREDKNQAFTPDHIVEFMCDVVGITKHSKVLDPCCGSGSFLVRALTDALDDCDTKEEQEEVKKYHIYGIEYEETAFGLATTNMLIHGDGNSNIVQDSCFNKLKWIKDCHIDTVLMNPPYNAQQKYCNKEYVANWSPKTKEDPSKGFHFVYEIAKQMTTGKLAVLLPPSCAIGSSRNKDIIDFKRKMLIHHHLDAVFSFPDDIFHPGSNSSACCMIFDIGVKHDKAPIKETFFGYFKDDGFKIKKNLGRIERKTDIWKKEIKPLWLKLYRKRISKAGISANRVIDENDEWLAEAYMETDYSLLTSELFENEIKSFYSYQIIKNLVLSNKASTVKQNNFRKFYLKDIFTKIEYGKVSKANDQLEEGDDIWYLGAKKDNNGLMQKVKKETAFVSKGNCVVFICDGQGSVGYANYMDSDFVGTINLAMGYSERLNKYSGLYIATVVSLERPKFSYGRKWKPLLEFTEIKLPAILNTETNKYEPDWQFMENYIKSLPYGDMI